MNLQYCGYAYTLFNRILGDNQYAGEDPVPSNRLFNQFHCPQTSAMKKDIMEQLATSKSHVRVVFATAALGMGVDVPCVENIIHLGPPSSLELYMQEVTIFLGSYF